MLNRVLGFDLVADSLEGSGVVHCEVSEHLAVDLDTSLMDEAHELGVGKILKACGSVDTLNPEGTEVTLLVLAVTVSVGETLFPCVLCYGPHVAAASEVTTGKFEDFFAASS